MRKRIYGGGGVPPRNRLEDFKKRICVDFMEIYHNLYEQDDELFLKDIGEENRAVVNGILHYQFGMFTSDYMLDRLQLLLNANKEVYKYISINKNELICEDVLIHFKHVFIRETIKLIKNRNLENGLQTISNIDLQTLKGFREEKTALFNLDFIIGELDRLLKYTEDNAGELSDRPLSEKMKYKIADEISRSFKIFGIKQSTVLKYTDIDKTTLSQILNRKLDRISIERILNTLEKIAHEFKDFQMVVDRFV